MQQTETYKLNLIESSDPFLPDALNENTQKIEEVVSGSLGDMDERIKVFEAKRFAYGSYSIREETLTIPLGFTPKAVIIHYSTNFAVYTALAIVDELGNMGHQLKIVEGGFQVSVLLGSTYYPGIYNYIAFG